MTQTRATFSDFQSLAAQWRVLGMMALAFARRLVRSAHGNRQGACEKIVQLEAWLAAALFAILHELATNPVAAMPEQAAARQHLQAIMIALMTLAVFLQRFRQGLAQCWTRAPSQVAVSDKGSCAPNPAPALGFNDSG